MVALLEQLGAGSGVLKVEGVGGGRVSHQR